MSKYLLVSTDILPEIYEAVLIAKEEVAKGKAVSSVCKELNISRSTFYKYKDKVFYYDNNNINILKIIFNKEDYLANKLINILNDLNIEILEIKKEDIMELSLVTLKIKTTSVLSLKEAISKMNGFMEFVN